MMVTGFFTELKRNGCANCGGYLEEWTEQVPDSTDIVVHPEAHLGACAPLEPGAREAARAFQEQLEAERAAAMNPAAPVTATPVKA
jgi:hypothetical protein